MRILVATDAWHPQVNGVVKTYTRLAEEIKAFGAELVFLTPNDFSSWPCPGYPEILLAFPRAGDLETKLEKLRPDHVHIATEGPVGWAVRKLCLKREWPFTTSYHTKFPEYLSAIFRIPEAWTYRLIRKFHAPSAGVMVATPSLAEDLKARGFTRLMAWTRGVDTNLFQPRAQLGPVFRRDGPVFLNAGRVSREKNIEAFLDAKLPGVKVVVGDGPRLEGLKQKYKDAVFTGYLSDEDLARHYAAADVFVFPSKTDTFGLVLLEAMASGLPVAAYPVTGPLDVVDHGTSGVLDWDIEKAAFEALKLSREAARAHALKFNWPTAAKLFLHNINSARAMASGRSSETAPLPVVWPHHNIFGDLKS